jgi:hypothetical protein
MARVQHKVCFAVMVSADVAGRCDGSDCEEVELMDLKPGSRWKSAVCSAEMVVVRPPTTAGILQCGGADVLPQADPTPPTGHVDPAHAQGVLIGKRYTDTDCGIEVLGAKPGAGSLSFDGRPLTLKEAKPLPASD